MDRIETDVREALRRRVTEHGGAAEYADPRLFERVWSLLGHAADGRSLNFLLLPELLDDDWDLKTDLRLSTHRPFLGPIILLVKRRVLLPLSRWLLEYSRENFRRQQHLNRILFACIEELAIENARLRLAMTEATGQAATEGTATQVTEATDIQPEERRNGDTKKKYTG
jgi:hypothetical protein